MKKLFNKIPYKSRIACVILLFTLIPCILLETIYLKSFYASEKQSILTEYQSDTDSVALMVSKNITELHSKMRYILNNSSIRSAIAGIDTISLIQALDFITLLDETAESIAADNHHLVVRLYPYFSSTAFGTYCYPLNQFLEEFSMGSEDPLYKEIRSLKEGNIYLTVRQLSRNVNNTGTQELRFCFYTQLTNLNGSNCIIELSIPMDDLLVTRTSDFCSGSIFAITMNEEHTLNVLLDFSDMTSEEADTLLTQYHEERKLGRYEIVNSPIPNYSDSDVVFLLPKHYVQELIYPQILKVIIISVFIVFLLIATSYLTSYLLTRKVIHTVNNLNNNLNGILTQSQLHTLTGDDLDLVSLRVQELILATQEYCKQLEHYEAENLRMELELLQMRFNPHLLYNTLSAIHYQVKNTTIRNTINSLCSYYRIVLNNGHLFIRIADEIDMIKHYLSIQKFAYKLDNIQYVFEIDEAVTQYLIIKHLLQPIIENALNHGLRLADHDGILRITVQDHEEHIDIQITDNGVGMTQEEITQILKEPKQSVVNGGYGIYNVQQRIQVYYGAQYGLTIHSELGKGTTVTLKIPHQTN